MENKKKPKPEGDLEVTGVSRSGRVRKKSSKLVDFESSDEVVQEKRPYNKKTDTGNLSAGALAKRGRPPSQNSPLKHFNTLQGHILPPEYQHQDLMDPSQDSGMPDQHIMDKEEIIGSDMSDTEVYTTNQTVGSGADEEFGEPDSSLDAESIGSVDMADNLLIDEDDEMSQESVETPTFLVDGKPLPKKRGPKPGRRKNQRKDKGKARFTAYMLWAKSIRQKLIKSNPEMDFSQVSKKLGELWHTVPFNEKYGWKRQADRMAAKYSQKMSKSNAPAQKTKSTYTPHGRVGRPPLNRQTVEAVIESKPSAPVPAPRVPLVKPSLPADLFKVTGSQPLDISAHLRLLGDNLTIIGERLKDTQGRMAISGGMSLLLDSFLCALGPLLCLTQQIPEENGCSPETLSHILDNIAYIMPGL